jgi:hypothetical protein
MGLSHLDAIVMFQERWGEWRHEFAALNAIVLILLVVVTAAWGRHAQRRAVVASGCIIVLAITLGYCGLVRSADIPTGWITILHEGLEYKSIRHLYTNGVHAGPNFAFVINAAAAAAPTLRDVVWLNLLLAVVKAAIFLHVALFVTGPVWAFVWTLVFALNAATFLASFSEMPTNLLGLYFLIGVVAWAALNDPLPQPAPIRAAACLLCAVLTVLVALTRLEVALIGVVALVLYAADALVGRERWIAVGRRLGGAGRRALVWFSDHPAAVAALGVAGCWLAEAGLPWMGRASCAALYPFDPSVVSLYVFLPMLLLPIGVSIGTLLGLLYSAVHFRRFGGLALAVTMLTRSYFSAYDSYYEAGRYLSNILPAIFFLGLFGAEQLREMGRRWRPNWYRAALIGYLLTWFSRPVPGALDFLIQPEYTAGGGFGQVLLDLNTQREVRHLLALTENNPGCVFIARVLQQHDDPMRRPKYEYAVFGKPVAQPVFVPEEDAQLADLVAQYASGVSCVRLYYGGDCNLTFGDRCREFVAGRRLVDEERFWSRPYNNPLDLGYGAPEIVLATYAWP